MTRQVHGHLGYENVIGGMWLSLIGWFLNSGAQSYLEQHQLSIALSGIYLKDIMNTRTSLI
jgi:hypothetical protein